MPLPNLAQFPHAIKERILTYRYYNQVLSSQDFTDVKEVLKTCDTCEPETRGQGTLDMMPSAFFCCVYRLLMIKLTEAQLKSLMDNRNIWVRCAGFFYVRLGINQERYWELLSDYLLDVEEFMPFPTTDANSMTEGEFVEHLFTKEKYCDLTIPRLAAAQKRTINERLVCYEQFRRRYAAQLEVLERFDDKKGRVEVEVCNHEGEWTSSSTVGPRSPGRRRVTVPVRFPGGGEKEISLGMLIVPQKVGERVRREDLTRSRGRSNKEIIEDYRRTQRDGAVASGKDYCKTSGRHTVHAGGVTFVCGGQGDEKKRGKESDSEDEREREAKKRKNEPSMEHQAKMAAIMSKYCAGPGSSARSGSAGSMSDATSQDRLRLGL